jgi:hypothetical protein
MRIIFVLCLALVVSGCDRFKKHVDPSQLLPVITRFEYVPNSGKAPLLGEFIVETTGAESCNIEPSVRAIACVGGRKLWPITVTGDYVLTATNATGQSASQAVRVTIIP